MLTQIISGCIVANNCLPIKILCYVVLSQLSCREVLEVLRRSHVAHILCSEEAFIHILQLILIRQSIYTVATNHPTAARMFCRDRHVVLVREPFKIEVGICTIE